MHYFLYSKVCYIPGFVKDYPNMGLFSFAKNLFKKEPASEYIQVQAFISSIDQLLSQDRYLARSDYQHLPDDYSSVYELYDSSKKSNSLSYLIKKQRANKETVDEFLKLYEQIKDLSKQPDKIRSITTTIYRLI